VTDPIEPIECASRFEITALQEKLLGDQLANAWRNVEFYHKRWEAAGLRLGDIRTLDDLRRLPVVTKADFCDDLLGHPPFGSYQGSARPARIHASSGITGEPRPIFCSRSDCAEIARLSARRMRAQGVTANDLLQITLPYTLYIGGAIAIDGAIALGAGVIPTGTGAMTPSERQIEIARNWKPTVLCATPAYALRLAEVAREMHLDPARDFHFRMIYVTAGIVTRELRREIETKWNCRVYDNYGSVEAAASTYECRCQNGWHVSEDAYIFEVIHPQTGEPVPPGEHGVLVVTSLFREASPFFRYRVGDIVALWEEPCECGRTFRRMSPVEGRADEMIKFRGISVYPTAIERVLRSLPEIGSEWFVVVDRASSSEEITVQVESAAALSEVAQAELANRVGERLKINLGVRPEVQVFDPGGLVTSEKAEGRVKTSRVIERNH
jgi:phenylacetate-CoA ligase